MSEDGQKNLQQCKVFVGGLHLDTDNESLKENFSHCGEILDAIVMRDPNTKKSRGFGFVTFSDIQSVEACLGKRPHVVDGKEVEVKKAVPREDSTISTPSQRTKKVFLGGLSPDTTREDVLEAMSQFGKLIDVQIMTDKNTNKPRGFGFAIFEDYDVVENLCMKKYHKIKDRDVEVKKAVSQEEIRRMDARGAGGRSSVHSSDGYGRGGDPYRTGNSFYSPKMGYGGYDYSRYPSEYMRSEYMAGGAYSMGSYSDRVNQAYGPGYSRYPAQGYDMSAYGTMYPQAAATHMAPYNQSPSAYGPSRGVYGVGDKEKERGGAHGFHPYRRP